MGSQYYYRRTSQLPNFPKSGCKMHFSLPDKRLLYIIQLITYIIYINYIYIIYNIYIIKNEFPSSMGRDIVIYKDTL